MCIIGVGGAEGGKWDGEFFKVRGNCIVELGAHPEGFPSLNLDSRQGKLALEVLDEILSVLAVSVDGDSESIRGASPFPS